MRVQPYRLATNPRRRCMDCHKTTWKGKHMHALGYVVVTTVPGRKGKTELEHRLVMEKKLGRKLRPGEVVHHINHNRADNRPENLELCDSPGRHLADHHYDKKRLSFWKGKKMKMETKEKIAASMRRFCAEQRNRK